MNQRGWTLSANCSQKMEMVILNGVFMGAAEAAFWRFSLGKLFLNSWNILMTTMESDLSKIVPATLLKVLSVMSNFSKFFQEFNKNSFQYKKHLLGIVFQGYKWRKYVCDGGVASSFLRL